MKTKKVLTIAALLTFAGATTVVVKDDVLKDRSSVSYRLETKLKSRELDTDAQSALNSALALFARREKGDEPTFEEWSEAETAVDELRKKADSAELRKIDRMLETADATIQYKEEELNKEIK